MCCFWFCLWANVLPQTGHFRCSLLPWVALRWNPSAWWELNNFQQSTHTCLWCTRRRCRQKDFWSGAKKVQKVQENKFSGPWCLIRLVSSTLGSGLARCWKGWTLLRPHTCSKLAKTSAFVFLVHPAMVKIKSKLLRSQAKYTWAFSSTCIPSWAAVVKMRNSQNWGY